MKIYFGGSHTVEIESDLRRIRSLPVQGIAEWIHRRFLGESFPYWWLAIFESLETSLSPLLDVAESQRRRDFEIGVECVRLAVAAGSIRPPMGARWNLRLAATALRYIPPIEGLPGILTPDGAAELALDRMPLSRDRALMESKARQEEYLAAGEDFFAPVGQAIPVVPEADNRFSTLQDVELILSALPWVSPSVESEHLRREIDAWLKIRNQL
ncbi:hypothetical protein ACFWBH_01020 [Streptomyces sp. NPDC059999]|uniref:hypothetical protein n=1 Tax=Streptomyces sp. NPDC059999 TaxID=3347030 RepID=UPI0036C9BCC1